jgi:hypothetical protein
MNEAFLEMYYFKSIVESLRECYGNIYRIYKPSPRRESWVGFDQGWTRSVLPEHDFFNEIRNRVQNGIRFNDRDYVSYFLQFKVVKQMVGVGNQPQNFHLPFYFVDLSLIPNNTTGMSQHQTLNILGSLGNVDVNYVCPMIFEPPDLYEPPEVNLLRFVKVDGHQPYPNNTNHRICFQTIDSGPVWFSDPIEGYGMDFEVFKNLNIKHYSPEELINRLQLWKREIFKNFNFKERIRLGLNEIESEEKVKVCQVIPSSLVIFEVQKVIQTKDSENFPDRIRWYKNGKLE